MTLLENKDPIYDLISQLVLNEQEQKSWDLYQEFTRNRAGFKQCKRCGKFKRIVDFYRNPLKRQGVFDVCKDCCIKEQALRRANNATKQKRERCA